MDMYSYINNGYCFEYFVGYEITALLGYKNAVQTLVNVSKQNKLCNKNGDFRILNFFEIIFKNKSKCDNTGIFG